MDSCTNDLLHDLLYVFSFEDILHLIFCWCTNLNCVLCGVRCTQKSDSKWRGSVEIEIPPSNSQPRLLELGTFRTRTERAQRRPHPQTGNYKPPFRQGLLLRRFPCNFFPSTHMASVSAIRNVKSSGQFCPHSSNKW